MKKKIILSICIPTYNRSKLLEESLKKWVIEVENNSLQDIVEIVIGNNDSRDNTEEIIEKYSKQHSFIRSFKNKTNLGFTGNIIKLYFSAKGEYIWLIGDDDFVYKNTLAKVLKEIDSHHSDLVYMNYDAKVLDKKVFIKNMLNIQKNYFFENRRDFFRFFKNIDSVYRMRSTYLTFISLYVAKRHILIENYEIVKDLVDLKKQHFPHSWILWENFPKNKISILKESLFVQFFSHTGHTTHSSGWFDTCVKFRKGLNPLYCLLIKKYGNEGGAFFKIYLYGGRVYSYLTIFISFIFLIRDRIKILLSPKADTNH